jgi:uncharacterized repeat protein (TIGR01451 family)
MKMQTSRLLLMVLCLSMLSFGFWVEAQEDSPAANLIAVGPGQRYTESIMVVDLRDHGYQPIQLAMSNQSEIPNLPSAIAWGGGSDPHNPHAVIRKTAPTFVQPGGIARYEITLANYESMTHTYRLTDTLPPQLTYVADSASELVYDPAARTLSWQGELSPGNLDYVIEEHSPALPYLDLAAFGAVNLCDDFIAQGESCDDVSVTFNLGVNGYTTNLYGEALSQLTVSANGLILQHGAAASGHNRWLPDATAPGFILAGLWRDVDMGGGDTAPNGRFHAAIVGGLLEGHDVFYAQWHDAPHANNPDLTARQAIALLLNKDAGLPAAAHAFFIYDNISDPAQLLAQGYTIGIADKLGARGGTYAYAPCCGTPHPPQGYPPAAGTTLHLRPVLFGAVNDYSRTFSYEAMVNAQVPETITSTAVAVSSSGNPALAHTWSTHYLYVRWQTYLPVLRHDAVVAP